MDASHRCGSPGTADCLLNQLGEDANGQNAPTHCVICRKSERDLNRELRGVGKRIRSKPETTSIHDSDALSVQLIERMLTSGNAPDSDVSSSDPYPVRTATDRLTHPAIVPVFRGTSFPALENGEYPALSDAIASLHDAELPKSRRRPLLCELLRTMLQVVGVITHAHENDVLHGDIRPQNILLGRYGTALVAGWDHAVDKKCQVRASAAIELPLPERVYMSPEVAGFMSPTRLSDVFSLGATLCDILTGDPPYNLSADDVADRIARGETRISLGGSFRPPPSLLSVCRRAMAIDPRHRYQNAKCFGDDIRNWLDDEPVDAHRESWFQHAARRLRRMGR